MKTPRPRPITIAIAACVMFAATGCRTAGLGNLNQQPSLFPNRTNQSASQLLIEHNRNAELVQTLRARPNISISDRKFSGGASGKLALERPRNFKLELAVGFSDIANIGSNNDEFWFWVKASDEKAIYYCDYDENGDSPLAGSLQPDWITEAFCLKVFTEEETAAMKVRPGNQAGTLVISQTQKTPRGETVIKEMILSESTHRIREHRVYSGDHQTLLARATINDYLDAPLPGTNDASDGSPAKVFLPKALKLEWMLEKLSLDILMSQVVVNPVFDDKMRASVFVEPNFRGYTRKNLMEREALTAPRTSIATLRETIPAPPPRVKLSDPAPIAADGKRRIKRDPIALTADLAASRPVEIEAVVGPTIPTVNEPFPGSRDMQSGWRNSIER